MGKRVLSCGGCEGGYLGLACHSKPSMVHKIPFHLIKINVLNRKIYVDIARLPTVQMHIPEDAITRLAGPLRLVCPRRSRHVRSIT